MSDEIEWGPLAWSDGEVFSTKDGGIIIKVPFTSRPPKKGCVIDVPVGDGKVDYVFVDEVLSEVSNASGGYILCTVKMMPVHFDLEKMTVNFREPGAQYVVSKKAA